ncbi:hypothetical protein [Acidovorax sp. SUPP3334]|uniref:hypothetical protein n=1 Tax=Acidovorax sp. SUPP3334 TaxID=2920881 RepID=UPI0023DE3745|nr:hypothetical protein [Acidovorax sp. SUPP3334]GKT20785.1 hypothetical protein AVHM3334_02410 [Acidovorax sp. SUPP3334]
MYLVVIGWLYVTLLMAVAEAMAPNGTVLGAIITFALYGLLPMSIAVYILGTPGRKRAIHARQLAERDAQAAAARNTEAAVAATKPVEPAEVAPPPSRPGGPVEPDAGSEASTAPEGAAVSVRKEM